LPDGVSIAALRALFMGDKTRNASLAEARSENSMLTMDRTPEVSHEAA